jgi:hypothetical protein
MEANDGEGTIREGGRGRSGGEGRTEGAADHPEGNRHPLFQETSAGGPLMLILPEQRRQLRHHAELSRQHPRSLDHPPVAFLVAPALGAWWLLPELDRDHDTALGLLGRRDGRPARGTVSVGELAALRGPSGRLLVDPVPHFRALRPLSEYASDVGLRAIVAR